MNNYKEKERTQNKKDLLEIAAEQWVSLVMAHIAAKKKDGKVITHYKYQNNYGKSSL
jgi:hypothetical protein